MGLASCGWRERNIPFQVTLQSQPQVAEVLRLCIRSLGCMASLQNSGSLLQRLSVKDGEVLSYAI